jgi:hypothetical protein
MPTLRPKPKCHAHLQYGPTIWKIHTTLVTSLKVPSHLLIYGQLFPLVPVTVDLENRYTKKYPMGVSPHPAMIASH